jgi:ribosome-binding factor A
MATRRQRQVAELLHEEISQLLQYNAKDPRLGFVTVTGVEVTPDLRWADVYITVLGDDEDTESTLEGLASAAGYFRYQMNQSLSLRYIPELRFRLDKSLEYGLHIDNLLDKIKDQYDEPPAAAEDAGTGD